MRIARFRQRWSLAVAAAAMLAAAGWWYGRPVAAPAPVGVQPSFANLPLAFEPNRGQSDPAVLFQSRNTAYSLYLTADEAVVGLREAPPLRLAWEGANRHPEVTGQEPLPGRHHYLKGNDPARWQRNIPTYGKVRYHDLYPGIDLVYYGRDRRLEYDLIVAPGADPAPIALALAGMDHLRVDDEGAVQVQLGRRSLSLSRPVIYQDTEHGRRPVDGGYVRLADNRLGLRLGAYDKSRPLIIDPVLSFSTYLGGSGAELARGVAVDSSDGSIYVVGQTTSQDISFTTGTNGAIKTTVDTDVLIARFDSSGQLLAVSYLGGEGTDRGFSVAARGGAVYVVGDTTSEHFPILAAAQTTRGGDLDAFVVKLDSNLDMPSGSSYATYLGGTKAEEALGVAVDDAGDAFVAGATLSNTSDGFPFGSRSFNDGKGSALNCTSQTSGNETTCSDAFVAKYDSSGTLSYATYLGGELEDTANAIAVNGAGDRVLVTGISYRKMNALTAAPPVQGPGDAYIFALDGAGTIIYGTYVGGSGFDQGQSIALDGAGNVYMAGITNSTDLSAPNAFQLHNNGAIDGFVVKLKYTSLPSPTYSTQYITYLGGSPQAQSQSNPLINNGQDQIFGLAVDSATGDTYVVGETMSADFPEKLPLQSVWFGGGQNGWGDAFVTKFDAIGHLIWSTYLGGRDDDWASGVALGACGGGVSDCGAIYVAGSSFSTDFPMANAGQSSNKGNGDAFLLKLDDSNPSASAHLKVDVTGTPDLAGTGETITYTAQVSNLSSNNASGVLLRATLPSGVSYQSATPSICTVNGQQLDCRVGTIPANGSSTVTIKAANNTAGDITFTAQVVRAFQPDSNDNNNTASVTTKAALGSSGGGGAFSALEATLLLVYGLRRRRGRQFRPI